MSDAITIKGQDYTIGTFTAKTGMRVYSTIVTAASLAAKANNANAFLGYLQGSDYDFVFDECLSIVSRQKMVTTPKREEIPMEHPIYNRGTGKFSFPDLEDGGVTALKLVTAVLEKRIAPFFDDKELYSRETQESDSPPALTPASTPSSGVQ